MCVMGFYLWKPNPDRLVERHRKEMEHPPPPTHTLTHYPEAADTVVGLVHDLVVNSPVAITESCHCNRSHE